MLREFDAKLRRLLDGIEKSRLFILFYASEALRAAEPIGATLELRN
jgi:hypothetical protein